MTLKNKTIITMIAPNVLAGAERVVIGGLSAFLQDPESECYNLKLIVIKESRFPERAIQFIQEIKKVDTKRRIQIIEITTKKAWDLNFFFSIKRALCGNHEQTLIHTHGYKALIYSYFATLISCSKTPPIVHTHHGNTGHTKLVRIYESIALFCMRRIKKVIAVSEVMKKELQSRYKLKNVELVINMLSFNNLLELKQKRIQYRQQSNSHLLRLAFIGRLSPEKGPYQLLKFFSTYVNRDRFLLTFIGDGPERIKMDGLLKEKPLNNVKFTGFINSVAPELITQDVLVMPSFTEGLPMTLIETAALGLPVIATDVGAVSSIVKDNENGLLLQLNDENSWHKALDEIFERFQSFSEKSNEKSSVIENLYSKKNWSKTTLEIYKQYFT